MLGSNILDKENLPQERNGQESFVLKSLVPPESSQDNGNFPVRSFNEANFPYWKPAFRFIIYVLGSQNKRHVEEC